MALSISSVILRLLPGSRSRDAALQNDSSDISFAVRTTGFCFGLIFMFLPQMFLDLNSDNFILRTGVRKTRINLYSHSRRLQSRSIAHRFLSSVSRTFPMQQREHITDRG